MIIEGCAGRVRRIDENTGVGLHLAFRQCDCQDLGPLIKYRQKRPLVMELLHRYSGLKQLMIAERLGGLDEGLVSRDPQSDPENIETEPKIRKWFRDLMPE